MNEAYFHTRRGTILIDTSEASLPRNKLRALASCRVEAGFDHVPTGVPVVLDVALGNPVGDPLKTLHQPAVEGRGVPAGYRLDQPALGGESVGRLNEVPGSS